MTVSGSWSRAQSCDTLLPCLLSSPGPLSLAETRLRGWTNIKYGVAAVHLPSHLLGNFNLPRDLISNGLLERTLKLALARALLAADQKDRQPLSVVIACEHLIAILIGWHIANPDVASR